MSHGEPEALEQFAHRLGVADRGLQDAGRQIGQAGQGQRLFLDFAERLLVEFDLEIDVAQAVVAVDLGRAAGQAQGRDVADHHRAVLAGYGQAFQQGQILARFRRQLDDDGNLPLRQVELGDVLVVVAGGGDAQRIGDDCRGDAEIGHAREIRAHHEFRANQAGGRGHRADAGDGAQLAFDGARVLGEQGAVFAGQHQHVFFVGAAEADLDLDPGQHAQCLAQLAFDFLFPDAATFLAWRQVDGQRRLAHLGRALRREGVAAGRPAADGGGRSAAASG